MIQLRFQVKVEMLYAQARKELDRANRKALRSAGNVVVQRSRQMMSKKASRERNRILRGPVGRNARGQFTSTGTRKAGLTANQFPMSHRGNYRRSIRYDVKKFSVLVGASFPKGAHAALLKYGTRRMAPRLVPSEEALKQEQHRLPAKWRNTL